MKSRAIFPLLFFVFFPFISFGQPSSLNDFVFKEMVLEEKDCSFLDFQEFSEIKEVAQRYLDMVEYNEKKREAKLNSSKNKSGKKTPREILEEDWSSLSQRYIFYEYDMKFEKRIVPLKDICFGHPIDEKSAKKDLKERTKILKKHRKEWRKKEHIAINDYQQIIPSNRVIEVYRYKDKFFLNEGNGRVKAIKNVFPPETKIEIIIKDFPREEIGTDLEKIIEKFYSKWDGCQY